MNKWDCNKAVTVLRCKELLSQCFWHVQYPTCSSLSLTKMTKKSLFFFSGKKLTSFRNQWSFFTSEEFVLWHMCILVWKDLVGGLVYWFDIWWMRIIILYIWFSSVQSLSHIRLFATPQTAARQAYQLPELTQTHAHRVSDAIQPSHLLSSLSPPTFNLSQHQGLFQWVSSSHQVAEILEFQLQNQSFQWIFRTDFL